MPEFSPDDTLERGPYRDGFTTRTVVGALFVSFVMMPGAIYLGLVAGRGLGSAAEWVTIILFAEVARRSFTHLSRQEIFVLFYVASGLSGVAMAHLALAGGPFAVTIWGQYMVQSPETSAIAAEIPDWVVPPADSPAITERNLAHPDWWYSASHGLISAMVMICVGQVLGRMAWFGMGYVLFRLVSDRERLPFPLAPIAAEGATALAESTGRDETLSERRKTSWRWNVFSVGATLGIVFGFAYVCLPVLTGLFMTKPIMLFPIPFIDFTSRVEQVLPASLVSISFDAGLFLAGMVLPFPLVVGTFIAAVATGLVANPILQKMGAFEHWTPGNGLLVNQMILGFDFWMSVSLGLAGAVGILGIYALVNQTIGRKRETSVPLPEKVPEEEGEEPPYRTACKQRGDFPMWVGIALFTLSTGSYCWLCKILVPGFPIWIVLVFGFLWTPIQSYVSARLVGMTGRGVSTPFLKETVFITSGYKPIDIWFAPIPLGDYGGITQRFRELELTRTKFTSIIKAEVLMIPISLISSFFFWWVFWKMSQVPSETFPFASRIWPVAARQSYLILTANASEHPLLLEALKAPVIVGSLVAGLGIYPLFALLGVPVMFYYGLIGGVGAPLHAVLPLFLGGIVGRYYFRKKFGTERWSRYAPVVAAGFSCGMGLAGMLAVAAAIVSQCTRELPY